MTRTTNSGLQYTCVFRSKVGFETTGGSDGESEGWVGRAVFKTI